MKKNLLSIILCLAVYNLSAQTEVEPFVPGSTLEGVCYYLPRTAFRVTVIAEKTTTRPGDFYKYADRYLRLQNVPTEESVEWHLKSITLEPYGKPDKEKAFSIKLKSKTVAPLVGLSRDGLLLSINCDADEKFLPDLPKPEKGQAPENPRSYMTQEILAAGSTAKMAELCAQEIYDIRDSKNSLVRGEADNTPKDGAQLKLMLDQLDKQASVLESLFSGTKPIPTAVPNEETAKKRAKMEHGVYYNIPVRTKIKVTYGGQEFVSMETPMAQFGIVEILSNTLFDKKTTTQVTFFQETGGTKDIME